MKVLFLIESLGRGGAEQVLANTLPELQTLGCECEVATLFERHDLADQLERKGIAVHRLNLSYKWNVIEALYKLRRLLKKGDYDLIHAHLFFAYLYAGLIKVFHPQVKTLTTFHNLGYDTYPADTLWKRIRKGMDAYVVNHLIDGKVAVSTAVQRHFAEHLRIPYLDVIHNSTPVNRIGTALIADHRECLSIYIDTGPFTCFSITPGRLVKEKGHKYLIEALQQLQQSCPALCHLIVGSGPLATEIEQWISERNLANVVLIPALEQLRLFRLIKTCDFVVVPSVSEGFGMVIIEAMALGRAIIATDISGIDELVQNDKTGVLVPASNGEALAAAMKTLCEDHDQRRRLAEAALRDCTRFDTASIGKQWQSYYQTMVRC